MYKDAISDYDIAISLDPKYARVYFDRGHAKSKLGRYFAALSDCDDALRLDPNCAEAYYIRFLVKRRLGHPIAAQSDYDTVLQLDPDYMDKVVYRLGQEIGKDFLKRALINPNNRPNKDE